MRDVAEKGDDKKKMYALRWEVYVKEKEDMIQRYFLVYVPHPKGENIVWNCVKDHITNEKDQYKAIVLCGFEYKLFEEEEAGGTK